MYYWIIHYTHGNQPPILYVILQLTQIKYLNKQITTTNHFTSPVLTNKIVCYILNTNKHLFSKNLSGCCHCNGMTRRGHKQQIFSLCSVLDNIAKTPPPFPQNRDFLISEYGLHNKGDNHNLWAIINYPSAPLFQCLFCNNSVVLDKRIRHI